MENSATTKYLTTNMPYYCSTNEGVRLLQYHALGPGPHIVVRMLTNDFAKEVQATLPSHEYMMYIKILCVLIDEL